MIFQWSHRSVPRIIFNIIQHPFFHWEKPSCFLFHWMFATDATDLLEVPHTDLLPGQVQVICALTELSSDRRSMCFGEWMACVTGDFWQIYDTCVVSMDWCNVYATSTCIWMYIYIYKHIHIYILYICIWWICVCYFRVYSCYSRDIRYTHMHIMFLATMIYHILFPDFQLNSLAGLAGFNFVGGYRSLAMRWSNKNREIDPEQWRHEPIGTWRTQKKQRDGLKHTNPGCHLHHPEVITSFMGAVNTVNHPQSCYIGLWQGCSHYITLLPKKKKCQETSSTLVYDPKLQRPSHQEWGRRGYGSHCHWPFSSMIHLLKMVMSHSIHSYGSYVTFLALHVQAQLDRVG